MSILLINASTKEKLEQALQAEETISENKNNFRFRRWWAKQRIAWMQALKTDLETQTDIRKLWNWWPSGFWLKVVVMFHRFFFQMKGDLNKDTLHDEGEELEKIQAELNAYGKSVHYFEASGFGLCHGDCDRLNIPFFPDAILTPFFQIFLLFRVLATYPADGLQKDGFPFE